MLARPRVNGKITAKEVRVVSEDGSDLGVLSISDAFKLVASRREDLVEIGPETVPPLCQVIDYGKYRYRWLQAERKKRGL
jgi:translation initiation factor IF-3